MGQFKDQEDVEELYGCVTVLNLLKVSTIKDVGRHRPRHPPLRSAGGQNYLYASSLKKVT